MTEIGKATVIVRNVVFVWNPQWGFIRIEYKHRLGSSFFKMDATYAMAGYHVPRRPDQRYPVKVGITSDDMCYFGLRPAEDERTWHVLLLTTSEPKETVLCETRDYSTARRWVADANAILIRVKTSRGEDPATLAPLTNYTGDQVLNTRETMPLRARWRTGHWRERYDRVVSCLSAGGDLADVSGLPRHEGLWDLRGIDLRIGGREIRSIRLSDGTEVHAAVGDAQRFERATIRSADMSQAHLGQAMLKACHIEDVSLRGANGDGARDPDSEFRRVDLSGARWSLQTLAEGKARYQDVTFDGVRLCGLRGDRGYFTDCDFTHAQIVHIEFLRSHFTRCQFSGQLDTVWFTGDFRAPGYRMPDPPNPMKDVDFSSATLWGVMISSECNLMDVIPPQDGHHILFDDWPTAWSIICAEADKLDDKAFRRHVKHNPRVHARSSNPQNIVNLAYLEAGVHDDFPDAAQAERLIAIYRDLLYRAAVETGYRPRHAVPDAYRHGR